MVSLAVSAKLQGRPEECQLLLLECLSRTRALADDQLTCLVLMDLAGAAIDQARYGEAIEYTLEALVLSHALADVHSDALALIQLAEVHLYNGSRIGQPSGWEASRRSERAQVPRPLTRTPSTWRTFGRRRHAKVEWLRLRRSTKAAPFSCRRL
jgi:hypothetical protein